MVFFLRDLWFAKKIERAIVIFHSRKFRHECHCNLHSGFRPLLLGNGVHDDESRIFTCKFIKKMVARAQKGHIKSVD